MNYINGLTNLYNSRGFNNILNPPNKKRGLNDKEIEVFNDTMGKLRENLQKREDAYQERTRQRMQKFLAEFDK